MKNAGMAGAVALVGIGLITIGLSNFANRAEAVSSAITNAGPAEPVIVAFGSLGSGERSDITRTGLYRLWSDGRIEFRVMGIIGPLAVQCGGPLLVMGNCGPADSGWVEVPAPPGGDGFACRGDINGDRNVDSADLGLLIAQWGQDISCDPQPSYPCFDLDGLNMNIAAR